MSSIAIHENENKKVIAKIQHFYDMLSERKKGCLVDCSDLDVESELEIIISHFERVFGDLIYKSS